MAAIFSDDPNTNGPVGTPPPVWAALLGVAVLVAFAVAFCNPPEQPDPFEPTPPSVIMPSNSWSAGN